ncbi:MAG: hypothetical protein UHX00_12440 [Caryophanon sp.]|nr:hypothetical protein [Caryophanon sp.]
MLQEFMKIIEIKTTDVIYKINNNYDASKDMTDGYKLTISPQLLQREDDKTKGLIIINTQIFDENYEEENVPFYLKITTIGEFDSENTGKPFVEFGAQALNITLPYVRSFITTLTSASGGESVTLPLISIEELLQSMSKNKGFESDEN